jgi:hypothetical protein
MTGDIPSDLLAVALIDDGYVILAKNRLFGWEFSLGETTFLLLFLLSHILCNCNISDQSAVYHSLAPS